MAGLTVGSITVIGAGYTADPAELSVALNFPVTGQVADRPLSGIMALDRVDGLWQLDALKLPVPTSAAAPSIHQELGANGPR